MPDKKPLMNQTRWILIALFVVLVLLLKGGMPAFAGLARVLIPLAVVYGIYRYFKGQFDGAKKAFQSELDADRITNRQVSQTPKRLCPDCGAHPKSVANCDRQSCPLRLNATHKQ